MDNQSKISLVGFLAALAALEMTGSSAAQALESKPVPAQVSSIELRLTRLTKTLKTRVDHLPDTVDLGPEGRAIAQWVNTSGGGFANIPGGGGFLNRSGGGGFVNRRPGGGFVNRRPGGTFINNPWRNGWGDGGGFLNRR